MCVFFWSTTREKGVFFKLGYEHDIRLVGSGEPVQPLNTRKTVSKVDDLSSMFTVTSYSLFWCALSGRRGWTLRDWSGACGRESQHSKYKFSSHPKIMELTGKCGIIRIMS